MNAIGDRNLLFGVLAVQLRGVSPAQLVELSAAWAADPSVSVPQRLVDKGLLTEDDRALLEKLVDDAIRAHGGDSQAVVNLFGGESHVEKTFFTCHDTDNLDHVDTSPMEGPTFFAGSGQEISGVNETPGRYTLISHHARGGMGRVLIVHDEYLGRNIALKELLPPSPEAGAEQKPTPMRQSAALVARFLQEARITSQLEHPAIVPVYELGRRQDGSLYYTMRLVRGKTFATALHECAGLEDRLRLLSNFIGLCQAIAYAHSRAVIHRDIKPANVMLGAFGETVVLDWGLAKVRDTEDVFLEEIRDTLHFLDLNDEQSLLKTAYGRALGTPHYMPVEQAEGRIDAIDERSDVYSLGAVLYEILTGSTPYSGKSTREILEKVIHSRHRPVLEAETDAPPELAVICEKALQKDPALRYQSAAELADEVRRFIEGSLVRAYRYSLRQVLAHYYSRHRLMVNTALAFAVVLLLVGAYSYVSIMQARDRERAQRLVAETAQQNEKAARTIAERKTYQSQIQLAQAYLDSREPARAAEALWATEEKERGWEWGYLLNHANPEAYTVETPKSTLNAAVFSPDGTRFGTNTHPEPPAIHEAATGRKLAGLEGEPARYSQTAFSPDGALYMGASVEGVINVWDSATGKRLHHFTQHAMGCDAVFNPSGTLLFAGFGDSRVRAYDLKTGAVAYELETAGPAVSVAAMSPVKDRLLTVSGEGIAQLWDLTTRTSLFSLTGVEGLPPMFSPDGTRIAALQGTDAVLWDAETGAELRRFKGHEMAVFDLRFNRDGGRLLSASQDGSVILWDTATGSLLQKYTLPDAVPALQAFFIADESAVLAYLDHHVCAVFSGASGRPVYQFQGKGKYGQWAAVQPNGNLVLLVPGEHLLQAVNLLAPTGVAGIVADTTSQPDAYSEVAASASGNLLAVSSQSNGMVRLIDPRAGKRPCAYASAYRRVPGRAALSADGGRLALLADDFVPAAVGDPAGAPAWVAFTGHTAPVTALALRPDGALAASGDRSGAVFLWDTASGQPGRTLPAQGGALTALQFSRDGQRLVSAAQDGTVTLWAADTGTAVLTLPKQAQPMVAAALNGSATRILTVNTAGTAQLWDAAAGTLTGSAQVGQFHESYLLDGYRIEAQFWPGDRLFLVRFPFERKKLWDADAWAPMVFLDENEMVQPMNNGRALAVVDRDGTVRVEDIPESTAALTPEAYAQYQQEWAARTALAIEADPPKTCLFISREDLAQALTDLARLGTETPGDGGVSLTVGTARTQPLAMMGLRAHDGVCAVNGTPFADPPTARAALEAAAQKIAAEPKGTLPVTTIRNGKMAEQVYWTLPLAREEQAVTLTRDEALGLVQGHLDYLQTAKQMEPDAAWMWVSTGMRPESSGKAPLTDLSFFTGIDGTPFDSMDGMEQALGSLRQRIASGEATQFSQTFRAGVYREQTQTITVEGK